MSDSLKAPTEAGAVPHGLSAQTAAATRWKERMLFTVILCLCKQLSVILRVVQSKPWQPHEVELREIESLS